MNEIFYNWIFKKRQITNYIVQKICKDAILTLNINLVVVKYKFSSCIVCIYNYKNNKSKLMMNRFLDFLKTQKKIYLPPLLFVLIVFGAFIILSQGEIVPFLYKIF